jgi:hypothetical protein
LIRWLALFVVLVGTAEAQIPKLDYSSYLGGSSDESAYAVATDSAGAVYVAGFTTSTDLPMLNSLRSYNGGGTGDLFIAKLKADGSGFDYITYVGGSGGEGDLAGYVGGIAVDAQGNAYVAGITRSADFPTTANAFQPMIGSQFVCDEDPNAGLCGDAFVLKLSPAGDRIIYSTFLGGSDYDDAKAITIDSTGSAYITGMTASPDFPATGGAFQSQLIDVDAYVAKLSPDGSQLLYSTLIGGTGFDAGFATAVDPEGRVYVAGSTQSSDFPVKNALQSAFGDPWDAFVLRVNATGSDLDFSTYLGGEGTQQAFGIALDNSENIYITGYTDSADFPIKNAFQPIFGGGDTNGFVTKLLGDGSAVVYSTFLGGADDTRLNTIAVDSAGNAYVAGQGGSDFPTVSSLQHYGGQSDAVVAKLSPDGSRLLYSTFIGGSGTDLANAIALDAAGKLVIAGQTSSADFPMSGNAFQSTLQGASDAVVVRLTESASNGPAFSSLRAIPAGNSYVGQWSPAQSTTISNVGTTPLAISSIVASSNVRVTSECSTLAYGASCSLSAQLLTTTAGPQSGTIAVYDNAPDSPQTITVLATGVTGGDLELASMTAGNSFSYYGKTAFPITATVMNHGPFDAADVAIRVTSNAGAAHCDPCYLGAIKAGATAIARFNFIPNTPGMIPLTAKIEAATNTPDLNPANDAFTIRVANPRYSASPAELAFDDQPINFPSAPKRITFTSLDQQPLQLSLGTSGDFAATLTCDPGALRCYADVTLKPTAAGARSGALQVTEGVAGTVQSMPLTGTGILAPHARLSETELVLISGMSASHSVTLTNDGTAPLFVVSIAVSGEFGQTKQCPVSLMPGESCSILVSFQPVNSRTSTGQLTIADNSSARTELISLKGFAVPMVVPMRPNRGAAAPIGTSLSSSRTQPVRPSVQRPPLRSRSGGERGNTYLFGLRCGSRVGSTIDPSRIWMERSANSAASGLCVIISTVWPSSLFECRSRLSTASEFCVSKLPVGSSARMMDGLLISARASATRCCSPPESSDGRCIRRFVIPSRSVMRLK